jgi:predicted amidohydrolase
VNELKIAITQHAPVFLNLQESLKRAETLAGQAAGQGADIIVFPETWLPGYPVWLDFAPTAALWDYAPAKALHRLLVENSVAIPGPHFKELLAIARKTGAIVVMGLHERLGGTLYNTIVYVARDGQEFKLHRKLVPTNTERMVWGRGDGSTLSVLNTEYGPLGGLICWEHWMPLARAAMQARRETIHVAQWPAVKELHHVASRHYAFEAQCFVVAAGCVLSRGEILQGFRSLDQPDNAALELLESMPGADEELVLKGGSAVIAPDTSYVTGPVYDEACMLYADVQLGRIAEGHLALDTQGHYSRPDVFHLQVNDLVQSNVTFESQE